MRSHRSGGDGDGDGDGRKVIKQARWLLLRNPQNLKTPEQQV
nr:hypothetical protein [Pseudomonas sp. PDM25]